MITIILKILHLKILKILYDQNPSGVWGLCHPQSVQGVSHFQILSPFPGLLSSSSSININEALQTLQN